MSSPRKFAEKIALIQQKQAEGDAAFNTIIHEVGIAKQRADHGPSVRHKLDVPTRPYEIMNGINYSDNNNYINQSLKNGNECTSNRLLSPPDNTPWRRTYSDSSLHQPVMPAVVTHYHAQLDNENKNQQLNHDNNDNKYDLSPYSGAYPNLNNLQILNPQYQPPNYYDLNNNNYANNGANMHYQPSQTIVMPQQPIVLATNNTTHAVLGPRYSIGNPSSNVLMLPPTQNSRSNGGSLPDLRFESAYNNNNNDNTNQQTLFSTISSTPATQQFFRSPSPTQNSDGDLFTMGPQQQSISRVGPLKPSSSIRRRHSPIGDRRQPSPRQQHSPSPDATSTQQNFHRMEPQSPQSISSYSSQSSPNFLPSPGNEHTPFSPPQPQSTDNQKTYFALQNQFDQITLDNSYYAQQLSSSPTSQRQQHSHSSSGSSGIQSDIQQQMNYYSAFADDLSLPYSNNQTTINMTTTTNQKSPTIPNIILTDADSSKLDLSKELGNDFPTSLDSLLDSTDLQLNPDDFLLNAADLSVDPINCDDTFCTEP